MSFMHFASQKSACLHFEHLVLAAIPHHSHIPDLGVRVLTAELAPAVTPEILFSLDTDRACSLPRPLRFEGERGRPTPTIDDIGNEMSLMRCD